ncbi:helix-turn-helix transcriptional regulator [Clostridium sp.]|uniref:ArsR/SmtB family transcription factor n=1 Tax=Clostridium sp. TaxID=1506 RepID=UPI00260F1B9C|nr:metalloregulator ArsR/SmtB family transcription factor [Clostridium sp.]
MSRIELIQIMKALSDETRVRILNLLMQSELCVGEIEYLLNINQSNASRHLSTLKNASIITFEKNAQWIFYSINNNVLEKHPFIRILIESELTKLDLYIKDKEMLQEYKSSGKNCSDLGECN